MQKRWRGQFAIADLLLGLTLVAAWTAYAVSHSRIQRLDSQIRSLQQSIGELVIKDATKYNAIAQTAIRYPDDAWQVYLPEGGLYQLNLVLRGIKAAGFPPPEHRVAITAGKHRIEVRRTRSGDEGPRFIVAIDDQVVLEVLERADWNSIGASSSTGVGKVQDVAPIDQPLVLKRLRAHVALPNSSSASPPDAEPANGLLLWIEAKSKDK